MNYRVIRCYQNCEKRIFDGIGAYDSPQIEPVDIDIDGVALVGYNYANTEKHTEDKICHFFIDDYQFERVWNDADRYLTVLRKFKAALSPDFSMYTDFPRAVQIFNHYRNQWLGAYWQEHGIDVIPTVGWSTEDSYDWCFDGVPKNALVCISTVGSFSDDDSKRLWLKGYQKSLEVLTPKKILFYGKFYPEIQVPNGIEYSVAENQNTIRKRLAREEAKKSGK